MTAHPGFPVGSVLPHTRTNDAGEFRFEYVPWWGKCTVYADDEDAGYSIFSTGPALDSNPPEVEITQEHPQAKLTIIIPPKAGFIQIHLSNQKTGAEISAMRVALMEEKNPTSPIFTMSSSSKHAILVRPDTNLLLHISSDGFREWNESIGKGKSIRLVSGDRLRLDVQLEPAE